MQISWQVVEVMEWSGFGITEVSHGSEKSRGCHNIGEMLMMSGSANKSLGVTSTSGENISLAYHPGGEVVAVGTKVCLPCSGFEI